MKVKELIAALSGFDPETEVMTEGCDCWGTAQALAVEQTESGPVVLIKRREGEN